MQPLSTELRTELLAMAKRYQKHAYAPYSQFPVGAAVLGKSGTVYGGCNVENASYPASRCAEQTAVQKAVSEGETTILAVAVMAPGDETIAPCGVCRQVLQEFGDDMWIILGSQGDEIVTTTLRRLMPHGFTLHK